MAISPASSGRLPGEETLAKVWQQLSGPKRFCQLGIALLLGLFTTFARVVELFEIEECNG